MTVTVIIIYLHLISKFAIQFYIYVRGNGNFFLTLYHDDLYRFGEYIYIYVQGSL